MNTLFLQKVKIDWNKIPKNSYLREIEAIKEITELTLRYPVTFFAGENGTGKSTLLEGIAVACGFNPEGGTRNYRFSTYDSHSELYRAIKPIRGIRREKWGYFLRAESFFNVATQETEYFGPLESHRYHEKSHGESFLEVLSENLKSGGLYFMDEPEAALSPGRQLSLLLQIHECIKQGSQFIIASHSPILLSLPGAEIINFGSGGIYSCDYEETDSYRVTEMFINRRGDILRKLLGEMQEE